MFETLELFRSDFVEQVPSTAATHRTPITPPRPPKKASAMSMSVRLATASDLEAMTWVLVGASPLDPVYPYRFPDRHLYPAEFTELCRQKCREYLATSAVVVCEMAPPHRNPSDKQQLRRLVAFSAWDVPARHRSRMLLPSAVREPLSRSSNNPAMPVTFGHRRRMDAFREACAANKAAFFDGRYPRGHVFLKILLCHPDYQRRGAGRALTSWGVDLARHLGLTTTVFASPMGAPLYRKLGFRQIGNFRVQLDGDDAFLEIPALVLKPQPLPAENGAAEKGCEGGVSACGGLQMAARHEAFEQPARREVGVFATPTARTVTAMACV